MWNLEKWYRWAQLQSRNKDREVEKQYIDTEVEQNLEIGTDLYTTDTMHKINN